MTTLVVYATKYGFTEQCAKVLAANLNEEVRLINIANESINDISMYKKIIIGSPIYAGMLNKKVKKFCLENLGVLLNKKVGLFVTCSTAGKEAIVQMEKAFEENLYESAVAKNYFGGKIDLDKAGFFDKLIIKMVSKADQDGVKRNDGIIVENIDEFINKISS